MTAKKPAKGATKASTKTQVSNKDASVDAKVDNKLDKTKKTTKKPVAEQSPEGINEGVETSFDDLGLPAELLRAVNDQGYEQPSPIQAEAIPPLLQGRDLLGQAQTGTGKTAAFALPLLSLIDAS